MFVIIFSNCLFSVPTLHYFQNKEAVKNVVKTAIPLSLGSLLEYGEWQILTIFVAALGPAEGKLVDACMHACMQMNECLYLKYMHEFMHDGEPKQNNALTNHISSHHNT